MTWISFQHLGGRCRTNEAWGRVYAVCSACAFHECSSGRATTCLQQGFLSQKNISFHPPPTSAPSHYHSNACYHDSHMCYVATQPMKIKSKRSARSPGQETFGCSTSHACMQAGMNADPEMKSHTGTCKNAAIMRHGNSQEISVPSVVLGTRVSNPSIRAQNTAADDANV